MHNGNIGAAQSAARPKPQSKRRPRYRYDENGLPLPKRHRTEFTEQQLEVLRNVFLMSPKLQPPELRDLAMHVNLPYDTVRLWFCNRRQEKSIEKRKKLGAAGPAEDAQGPGAPYDALTSAGRAAVAAAEVVQTVEPTGEQPATAAQPYWSICTPAPKVKLKKERKHKSAQERLLYANYEEITKMEPCELHVFADSHGLSPDTVRRWLCSRQQFVQANSAYGQQTTAPAADHDQRMASRSPSPISCDSASEPGFSPAQASAFNGLSASCYHRPAPTQLHFGNDDASERAFSVASERSYSPAPSERGFGPAQASAYTGTWTDDYHMPPTPFSCASDGPANDVAFELGFSLAYERSFGPAAASERGFSSAEASTLSGIWASDFHMPAPPSPGANNGPAASDDASLPAAQVRQYKQDVLRRMSKFGLFDLVMNVLHHDPQKNE